MIDEPIDGTRSLVGQQIESHFTETTAPLVLAMLSHRLKQAGVSMPEGVPIRQVAATISGFSVLEDAEEKAYCLIVREGDEHIALQRFKERALMRADAALIKRLPAQLLAAFCTPTNHPVYVTRAAPIKWRVDVTSPTKEVILIEQKYRCPHIHIHSNGMADLASAPELADNIRNWAKVQSVELDSLLDAGPTRDLGLLATGGRMSLERVMYIALEKATDFYDAMKAFNHYVALGATPRAGVLAEIMIMAPDRWGANAVMGEYTRYGLSPDARAFNILIGKMEKYNRAIYVYREMMEAGFEPDDYTYSALAKLCSNYGQVRELLDTLRANGTPPSKFVINIVVGMPNSFRGAKRLLLQMIEDGGVPKVSEFNRLLSKAKTTMQVAQVKALMEQSNVSADRITVRIAVKRVSSLSDALATMEESATAGILPDLEIFQSLGERASAVEEQQLVLEAAKRHGLQLTTERDLFGAGNGPTDPSQVDIAVIHVEKGATLEEQDTENAANSIDGTSECTSPTVTNRTNGV
ncbi:MAG TPA: hypothetical protein DDW73_17295 [Rhizobium sp.]|nr:hypothetical protein [Rhizobium sp.]